MPGTSPAALGTRDRIVVASARLLQRQGYMGTPIKQIARDAEATLGSLYHFFPGGKEELAAEAIRHGDYEFAEMLRAALDSEEDPAAAVAACAVRLAEALRESDWTDGCPVTATALETIGRTPEIQRACAQALRHWQELVADRLARAGIAADEARDLACTVINTLEGAELTCQVLRDDRPLRVAGSHLAVLIRTAARASSA